MSKALIRLRGSVGGLHLCCSHAAKSGFDATRPILSSNMRKKTTVLRALIKLNHVVSPGGILFYLLLNTGSTREKNRHG